jgi:hypothetical protein
MKVYTAHEQMQGFRLLNQELDEASKNVESMEEECTKRAIAVVEAEQRYKVEYYKTLLNYREEKDSMSKRHAEIAAADSEFELKKAKVLYQSAKDALVTAREEVKSIRQRMSNYQSVSSMARVEADLAGRG